MTGASWRSPSRRPGMNRLRVSICGPMTRPVAAASFRCASWALGAPACMCCSPPRPRGLEGRLPGAGTYRLEMTVGGRLASLTIEVLAASPLG